MKLMEMGFKTPTSPAFYFLLFRSFFPFSLFFFYVIDSHRSGLKQKCFFRYERLITDDRSGNRQ